jgi:hypothetical protein
MLVERIVMHREWPPEIVFQFELPQPGRSVSDDPCST